MAGVSLITGGKGESDRSPTDFYPTPSVSTTSLMELNLFHNVQTVLEPACGVGHITSVVQKYLPQATITKTDLYRYNNDTTITTGIDFLNSTYDNEFDLVITNPPFTTKILLPFIEKSIKASSRYTAMFLKITFLESLKRKEFFETNKTLKHIIVFSNRQPLYKNGVLTNQSNAICYCWFVWDKFYKGSPMVQWVDNSKEVAFNKANNIY